MFCLKCGCKIENDTRVCPFCQNTDFARRSNNVTCHETLRQLLSNEPDLALVWDGTDVTDTMPMPEPKPEQSQSVAEPVRPAPEPPVRERAPMYGHGETPNRPPVQQYDAPPEPWNRQPATPPYRQPAPVTPPTEPSSYDPPKRKHRGPIIALAACLLLLVGGGGFAALHFFSDRPGDEDSLEVAEKEGSSMTDSQITDATTESSADSGENNEYDVPLASGTTTTTETDGNATTATTETDNTEYNDEYYLDEGEFLQEEIQNKMGEGEKSFKLESQDTLIEQNAADSDIDLSLTYTNSSPLGTIPNDAFDTEEIKDVKDEKELIKIEGFQLYGNHNDQNYTAYYRYNGKTSGKQLELREKVGTPDSSGEEEKEMGVVLYMEPINVFYTNSDSIENAYIMATNADLGSEEEIKKTEEKEVYFYVVIYNQIYEITEFNFLSDSLEVQTDGSSYDDKTTWIRPELSSSAENSN